MSINNKKLINSLLIEKHIKQKKKNKYFHNDYHLLLIASMNISYVTNIYQ